MSICRHKYFFIPFYEPYWSPGRREGLYIYKYIQTLPRVESFQLLPIKRINLPITIGSHIHYNTIRWQESGTISYNLLDPVETIESSSSSASFSIKILTKKIKKYLCCNKNVINKYYLYSGVMFIWRRQENWLAKTVKIIKLKNTRSVRNVFYHFEIWLCHIEIIWSSIRGVLTHTLLWIKSTILMPIK